MISIAVQVGRDLKCLVRGPITNASSNFMLGGPGSSFEVQGEDRRVELNRECVPTAWPGLASDAATAILNKKFTPNVQKTRVVYGTKRSEGRETVNTLNQEIPDAYFLRCIARENNFHFWLEYTCRNVGDALTIEEIANFRSSPTRPDDVPPEKQAEVKLEPTTLRQLRVNVPATDCPNVTAFNLRMDAERPNRFSSFRINDRQVRKSSIDAINPQPAIEKGGRRFPGSSSFRDVCLATAGNEEETRVRAEAALTEAGWFLEATVSTTAYMLPGILQPPDVIEVVGLGSDHNGAYQVRAVTHVINAADHYMDIELRRNALGKE
jgi:hypothetical protein